MALAKCAILSNCRESMAIRLLASDPARSCALNSANSILLPVQCATDRFEAKGHDEVQSGMLLIAPNWLYLNRQQSSLRSASKG